MIVRILPWLVAGTAGSVILIEIALTRLFSSRGSGARSWGHNRRQMELAVSGFLVHVNGCVCLVPTDVHAGLRKQAPRSLITHSTNQPRFCDPA